MLKGELSEHHLFSSPDMKLVATGTALVASLSLALAAPAPVELAQRSSVGVSPAVVNTWAPLAQYAT